MREIIKQTLDDYFSRGMISDPLSIPEPEDLLSYAIEHAPMVITYEMVADYFQGEAHFKSACTRWGLLCDQDLFTRNYTVRRAR